MFNSINESERNSPQTFLDTKNSNIKNKLKSLDNSFDLTRSRKNPMSNRILHNNNYNSINLNTKNNIYEPKRISTNNSPIRFNRYGENIANNLNSMKNIRIGRVYNKINNKKTTAYIKKSPFRMKQLNNRNNNRNYNNSSRN